MGIFRCHVSFQECISLNWQKFHPFLNTNPLRSSGFFTVLNVVTGVLLGDELAGSVQDVWLFCCGWLFCRGWCWLVGWLVGWYVWQTVAPRSWVGHPPCRCCHRSGWCPAGSGFLLGKVKPKLPTGLVKEVKQLPESREMATIRFHMVPCSCGLLYEDRAAWKARPDKQVQEWIQPKVLHVTYGWAVTNQTCRSGDKEEFLVGCAKTPVASLDGVLSRSDACGVFVSRIAKESSEKHLVQWIDCGSLDSVSLPEVCILSSASSKSAPVAWRPGGGAAVGIRHEQDAPTEKPVSVWRFKGVPIQWTDDDLFKVMKEAGWSDCAVAYPTKRIWPRLVRCRPPFVVLGDVAAVRCEDVFLSLEKATSRATKRETCLFVRLLSLPTPRREGRCP